MIESDLVILLTLLLSAFFSGMEIAFVSSNRIYLEIEKLQGSYTSKVLKNITKKPSRFIASMLLGNNIALVVYGIFTGDRILQLFFPETLLSGGDPSLIVILYQTLISTAVILITAEFLPKVFFRATRSASWLNLKYSHPLPLTRDRSMSEKLSVAPNYSISLKINFANDFK